MDKFADIEAFVTVVDAGSFSAAADRLVVAKSAISRRVNQLEKRLGVRLINRTTRKISLTNSGRSFYQQARQILEDIANAEQSLTEQQASLTGTIRLAAPLSFGISYLTSALSEFLLIHPEIELDLDLDDREINLIEEGFDMTVRVGVLEDSSLIARKITSVRMLTCASPGYLKKFGEPQQPEDLAQHTGLDYSLITRNLAWRYRGTDEKYQQVLPTSRIRSNNGDSLKIMAIAGLGIIHQPTFMLADAILSGELKVILQDWEPHSISMYGIFPPGRLQPKRVREFSEFLINYFGETPPWDQKIDSGLLSQSHHS